MSSISFQLSVDYDCSKDYGEIWYCIYSIVYMICIIVTPIDPVDKIIWSLIIILVSVGYFLIRNIGNKKTCLYLFTSLYIHILMMTIPSIIVIDNVIKMGLVDWSFIFLLIIHIIYIPIFIVQITCESSKCVAQ